MERIFEPFYTTKANGMGLGLAVCRTIILAHSGSLSATNNATGRGATFHMTIPTAAPGNARDGEETTAREALTP
jgi:signal transduction histidine kinase